MTTHFNHDTQHDYEEAEFQRLIPGYCPFRKLSHPNIILGIKAKNLRLLSSLSKHLSIDNGIS